MGQSDNEAIVMETIRRHTGNKAVGESTRFAEDLRLSESSRRVMFSYMMETFTARGVNLPARGCYVSTFMPCNTAGEILGIVRRAFGHKAPAESASTAAAVQTPTVAVVPWSRSHGSGRPTTTGPMTLVAVIIKNRR